MTSNVLGMSLKLDITFNSGGPLSTMDSVLALHPAAPGLIPGIPKNFSEFLMLPRLEQWTAEA